MYSHVTRSQTVSLFGASRYRLTAQIHVAPDELRLIRRSRLDNLDVFHDPQRDEFAATAAAAHQKAKARGLFVTKARDATAIAGAELNTLVATFRSLRAFHINLADLLRGVTIQHKSLQAIMEIEHAIIECIDHVERFLTAARGYAEISEDIFAPGTDAEAAVPPAQWTRAWRR